MSSKPPLPPSFADMMLGRLAKWLRLLGADVAFCTSIDDDELMRRAERENRMVITRDRGIIGRESALPRLFINHDRIADQLRQVAKLYDLSGFEPFTRCLRCNVPIREVDRDAVRHRLWPFVYRTQEHIYECPSCERLYWIGTHKERALEDLAHMLGDQAVRWPHLSR